MKNIFKRLSVFAILISFVSFLFAEPASTGITDSDVKNWAKNLNSIQKELDALGVMSNNSINATAKQKASVDKILQKYGISGGNCIEKFGMISACSAIVVSESQLDAESAALLKSFGMDPLAELKKNVNSKDYALVMANSKAVVKAVENVDLSSATYADQSNDDSSDEESMEDYYARLASAFESVAGQQDSSDISEINEEGEKIKKLYEQLSKAKGDSGIIYKSKSNASKYKKTAYKKGTKITVESGDEDVSADNEKAGSATKWVFDLDKKKAELSFIWSQASMDLRSPSGMKNTKSSKKINYNITSVDYYYLEEDPGRSYGYAKEYVITTKEGPVFHFFIEWDDGYYNAFRKEIGIKGLTDLDYFWND